MNPLAGCLPALFQIPVFLALYRSFQNLAADQKISEPFLWLPNLEGPVFGERSSDWIFKNWHNFTPDIGWHDTIAYLSIPFLLYIAQTISLRILSPPSDDPTVQKSQQILKYLPLMLAYFSLSVPSGLGVYWITNNLLSTITTASIKEYLKSKPFEFNVDLDSFIKSPPNPYVNTQWGYMSEDQVIEDAKLNYKPSREPIIPADFKY